MGTKNKIIIKEEKELSGKAAEEFKDLVDAGSEPAVNAEDAEEVDHYRDALKSLETVPSGAGYAYKLFLKYPLPAPAQGRLAYMESIDAPVESVEDTVRSLLLHQGYSGDVIVEVHLIRRGEGKTLKSVIIPFKLPVLSERSAGPAPMPPSTTREALDLIRTAKEVSGSPLDGLAALFKTVVETTKSVTPVSAPAQPAPPASPDDSFHKFLAFLKAAKDMGLIPDRREETGTSSPASRFTELKELFDLMTTMFGFSQGEKPSLGVEIVRQLGQTLPGAIDKITDTMNKAIDSKARLVPPSPAPMGMHSTPPPSPLPHPLIEDLRACAQRQDVSQFPRLISGLSYFFPDAITVLNLYASEAYTYEQILEIVSRNLSPDFLRDPLKGYFLTFCNWYKTTLLQQAPPLSEKSEESRGAETTQESEPPCVATGVCETCSAEYEYEEMPDTTHADLCDAQHNGQLCGGRVVISRTVETVKTKEGIG